MSSQKNCREYPRSEKSNLSSTCSPAPPLLPSVLTRCRHMNSLNLRRKSTRHFREDSFAPVPQLGEHLRFLSRRAMGQTDWSKIIGPLTKPPSRTNTHFPGSTICMINLPDPRCFLNST